MKCISCESEINPKWVHAVEINVCPFCGKHIMEEHLKNLFSSLRETMENLSTYPDQLNDWMLSNHNYIKTDSPQIGLYMPKKMVEDLKRIEDDKDFQKRKEAQKFTVKVKTENGEEEVMAEKIQSEETTNDFFKRAEVIKAPSVNVNPNPSPNAAPVFHSPAEKTNHLKKVAQQIRRAGSQGLVSDGSSMMLPAHMLENADPEAVAEFQSMISSGDLVASSLPDSGGGDDDVPDFILAANQAAAANRTGGSDTNAKDLAALQRLQSKISRSRNTMVNGTGGKGSFSRS